MTGHTLIRDLFAEKAKALERESYTDPPVKVTPRMLRLARTKRQAEAVVERCTKDLDRLGVHATYGETEISWIYKRSQQRRTVWERGQRDRKAALRKLRLDVDFKLLSPHSQKALAVYLNQIRKQVEAL